MKTVTVLQSSKGRLGLEKMDWNKLLRKLFGTCKISFIMFFKNSFMNTGQILYFLLFTGKVIFISSIYYVK